MTKEYFWSACSRCKRDTRHVVLVEDTSSGDNHYSFVEKHSIIQCLGCEFKSFRYKFDDIEQAHQIDDDEWEVPSTVEYYPAFDARYVELEDLYILPGLVREIYEETMRAIRAEALTLGGLGLRGTIEAICNEQGISGKNLDARIARLATKGLISKKDAERLHGIRFLGNDAAHEIKKPKKGQLSVAVKIVNHLIQSVYILKAEVDGQLETQISEFDDFSRLLEQSLKQFSQNDEFPLAKLLGKSLRRLGTNASSLESLLQAKIQSGEYALLKLGKVANFAKSQDPIQHYIVT